MNIQDITDFLDLVKNPKKYEDALLKLKEEQDRLNAVIATVGKASELDKLRTKVEADGVAQEKAYAAKVEKLESDYAAKCLATENAKAAAVEQIEIARKAKSEADAKMTQANSVLVECNAKQKKLDQQQSQINAELDNVRAIKADYEEKANKLKAALG